MVGNSLTQLSLAWELTIYGRHINISYVVCYVHVTETFLAVRIYIISVYMHNNYRNRCSHNAFTIWWALWSIEDISMGFTESYSTFAFTSIFTRWYNWKQPFESWVDKSNGMFPLSPPMTSVYEGSLGWLFLGSFFKGGI